jgi:N-acetylglucosamine-6-phosphate deacetylase
MCDRGVMTTIDASRVLGPGGWTGPARVRLDGAAVLTIEPRHRVVGEAAHRSLVPGFVDVQVNGIDDIDVTTAEGGDWDVLDLRLAAQGVTAWCPTLVSMPLDRYSAPLARIARARERAPLARPLLVGTHLEGPFLGGAPGAHRRSHVVPVDLRWLDELPSHVAIVTLGAEQPLAEEATRRLSERGIVVAIGHSTAGADEFHRVVSAGARLVTHLFNGMSGLHHREPGVAAFTLAPDPGTPAPFASLIADGVHVDPRMVRLAFTLLGDRAVLVSDAVGWRAGSLGPIDIQLRDGAPRLADGTLAGSALTIDAAIRVCVDAGVPLEHACRAASTAPARLLGLPGAKGVAPGAPADLVALDDRLHVAQTWIGGTPVLAR